MRTIIHVNQHNIKANAKGGKVPVLTVKDYKVNRADVIDEHGKIVATVVYSPDKPLSCGAKVWIETQLEVRT